MILVFAILIALVAISGIIGIYIVAKGPDPLDRVLALDYLSIVGICAILLLLISTKEPMIFDVALCLALVGFLTAFIFSKFLPNKEK